MIDTDFTFLFENSSNELPKKKSLNKLPKKNIRINNLKKTLNDLIQIVSFE